MSLERRGSVGLVGYSKGCASFWLAVRGDYVADWDCVGPSGRCLDLMKLIEGDDLIIGLCLMRFSEVAK